MSAAFRGQREEVEQMKNCLRVLSQPTPSLAGEAELAADQQEREGALELLADLCENMDNAAGTPRAAHPRLQGPAPSPWSPLCLFPPLQPQVPLCLSLCASFRGSHCRPLPYPPGLQPLPL